MDPTNDYHDPVRSGDSSGDSASHTLSPVPVQDTEQRRLLRTIVGLLVLSLLGAVGLIFFRFQDSTVLRAQRVNTERTDCSRNISNEQQAVRDRLEFLKTQAELAGYRGQTATVNALTKPGGPIDQQIMAVQNLKPTQVLVAKNCPAP